MRGEHGAALAVVGGEAPDLASEVVAWRAWRVVADEDGLRLASVYKWSVWPAGEPLAAQCLRGPTFLSRLLRKEGHEAPGQRCECGVYGAHLGLVDECLSALAGQMVVARVLGEVSLWGSVIECERGFRASFAYPRRIYVPADTARSRRDEVVEALQDYGVPVEVLPVRCADAAAALGGPRRC